MRALLGTISLLEAFACLGWIWRVGHENAHLAIWQLSPAATVVRKSVLFSRL
jgi:hypothetical protein